MIVQNQLINHAKAYQIYHMGLKHSSLFFLTKLGVFCCFLYIRKKKKRMCVAPYPLKYTPLFPSPLKWYKRQLCLLNAIPSPGVPEGISSVSVMKSFEDSEHNGGLVDVLNLYLQNIASVLCVEQKKRMFAGALPCFWVRKNRMCGCAVVCFQKGKAYLYRGLVWCEFERG